MRLSIQDFKDYCREENIVFNMSELIAQIMLEDDRDTPITIDEGFARNSNETQEFSKIWKLLHPESDKS